MAADDLLAYYAARAREYDRIYEKPERQEELAALRRHLGDLLAGHDVLELACGTGYWTEVLAPRASSITATDLAPEVLEVARGRSYPEGRVRLVPGDAYRPQEIAGRFTAAFAGFLWSHVPQKDLPRFLDGLHRRLDPGALFAFADNRYAEGSSTPIAERDADGNTYQLRTLDDGSRHRVLKNFPDPAELEATVPPGSTEVTVTEWTYFWCLSYRL